MTDLAPTILLTRPRRQSERFADACRQKFGSARILVSPVIETEQKFAVVPKGPFDGVILTSENAVGGAAFGELARGMRAWCVGERTAQAARSAGLQPEFVGRTVVELAERISAEPPDGTLLYLRGEHITLDLAARLAISGVTVEQVIVYRQVDCDLSDAALAALGAPGPVILPIFSPRSALRLSQAAGAARAPLLLVALSQQVADAWQGPAPQAKAIAEQPDATHMLDSLAQLFREALA